MIAIINLIATLLELLEDKFEIIKIIIIVHQSLFLILIKLFPNFYTFIIFINTLTINLLSS